MIPSISPSAPTQIKEFAQLAIEEYKRPMSASEIEMWISSHNPTLFRIIAQKSPDYVHIILSLSPIEQFMKYRSTAKLPHLDRSTVLYGLPDAEYDEKRWIPTRTKHRICSQANEQKLTISLFPQDVVFPMISQVDHETVNTAWNTFATLVSAGSQLWNDLLRAIEDMKESIQNGIEWQEAVNSVLLRNSELTNPLIASDVVTILSKEAIQKKEEMTEKRERC
jgi:hypothetical protein